MKTWTQFRQLFIDRGLTPDERRDVLENLFVFGKRHQVPFRFRMAVLLVLSTIIATAGLISDSPAVVIGAMLVAPLMTPVMAAAGAVVMGWPGRFYSSIMLAVLMGLGALILSSLITIASPELVFIPEQVLARTRPTYYDLIIALAAGSAGAYTITRRETSAIPGVAVAVALLPPLASAGILFTSSHYELGLRAVLLFLVNLIAMVLSGALTFMAVGVSPATARRKSAAFARMQIMLFVGLTVAICVPLWFYSESVIFNSEYRAAKSHILQSWLKEGELELDGIEILQDRGILYMNLVGPKPPVSIGSLHEALIAAQPEDAKADIEIRYTWTQKLTGVWPQETQSVEQLAEQVDASMAALAASDWAWISTQYNADATTSPELDEPYTLLFKEKGSFVVEAHCGKRAGSYTYTGQSISVEIEDGWLKECRNNATMELFLVDLDRVRAAYIHGDNLTLTLANGAGTMYFKGVPKAAP